MITKLLTVYSRRSGLKFLQRTLKPVIGKIPGFNIADYELVCLFINIFSYFFLFLVII